MNLSDIINSTNNPQALLWLIVSCIAIIAGAVSLPIALAWMIFKSGKRAALTAGTLILLNAFFTYRKFPDKYSLITAALIAMFGIIVLAGALFIRRPDPTPEELEQEINKETRSALNSVSGKLITASGTAVCILAIWALKDEGASGNNTDTIILLFSCAACCRVLALLFPSTAAKILETINSLLPNRRRL